MRCTQPYPKCHCRSFPSHLDRNAAVTNGSALLRAGLVEQGYRLAVPAWKDRMEFRLAKALLWIRGRR